MGWIRPHAAPTFLFFFIRSTSNVTDSALKSMSPSSVSKYVFSAYSIVNTRFRSCRCPSESASQNQKYITLVVISWLRFFAILDFQKFNFLVLNRSGGHSKFHQNRSNGLTVFRTYSILLHLGFLKSEFFQQPTRSVVPSASLCQIYGDRSNNIDIDIPWQLKFGI